MDANTEAVRVAVEGCGHGKLDDIYASVAHSAALKNWPTVDLLIICGDFQATRNAQDLNTMSVPIKYRSMEDFHKYYSGEKVAPYLTIFIGGNHEAGSHLRELYHGGWVAPNIYYMGAADVLSVGGLRIAGMSGIWKGFDYRKGHIERLPFSQDEVRSFYHVREMDVRKLLQIRTQVDVGLSHDWPDGMEWLGDYKHLFKIKAHFVDDANSGKLGSKAATYVLDWLRPPLWLSAHMHVRYTAVKKFEMQAPIGEASNAPGKEATQTANASAPTEPETKNEDEIDLDMDMDDVDITEPTVAEPTKVDTPPAAVPEDIRAQLPSSFAAPTKPTNLPRPTAIGNTTTSFLALDKLVPNHHFLQLLEITPTTPSTSPTTTQRPLKLTYDPEWLAITRAFAQHSPLQPFPPDLGTAHYAPLIDTEKSWVDEHITSKDKLVVPENFELTAPVHDVESGERVKGMPREYSNPQTIAYCEMLDIRNWWHEEEEVLVERWKNQPEEEEEQGHGFRGGRGGGRGRGRGRGGQGGGRGRGQGRGGGRGGLAGFRIGLAGGPDWR
ncbi:hypothetical protein BT63DRAFT_441455 [Microthyrium microscopicum]|uniref:Lariat debranching enzyme C-terminal domain-containing protein n=1 Tax=Microthyrium microscopicum TaxID=703497 RepID=A0A6A6U8I4_9PEZI|nr:hypothetical protein BT63DRAFT_441455 [Microthyrium microscopicum]